MKKRLLVLVVAAMMTVSVMTACGGKETAATTAAEATTVAATTVAAATTAETTTAMAAEAETTADAAEVDKVITNFEEYIAWTSKEWAAADDEEKLNAAIAYSVYTTEMIQVIGGVTADEDTRALAVEEMRNAPDIMNVVDQLNATLPSLEGVSLKDFADIAIEQINSAAGAETTVK